MSLVIPNHVPLLILRVHCGMVAFQSAVFLRQGSRHTFGRLEMAYHIFSTLEHGDMF